MKDLITENKKTDDIVSPAGASSVSYIFYTIKKAVRAEKIYFSRIVLNETFLFCYFIFH